MSKLVKNTAYYTIGNFTSKAINFLLLPLYTAYLTPEEYGIVSSIQVLTGVLLIFFTLGLERAIYRLFYDYDDEKGKKNFLGTVAISITITSAVACGLLFIFKDFVSSIYQSIEFYPYFSYGIVTAVFMTYEMVPKISLQVNEKARNYLILSLLSLIFRVIPVFWYVVFLKGGAVGMLKGAMIGNGALLIFLIPITLSQINLYFDIIILKSTFKYCLPFIPITLSAWVVNMSDRIFIEQFFSTYEVGIYSLGHKIGQSVQMFTSSIMLAYSPFFFKIANSEIKDAKDKLFRLNRLILILLIVIGFFVAFFSKNIIDLFFNDQYYPAHYIIPIIVLGYLFIQFNSLQTKAFYQEKKTLEIMYVSIIGAVLNIIFNYFLIKKMSYTGAAISTAITQFIIFVLTYILAKKYYFIPFDWKLIIPLIIVFSGIVWIDVNYISITVTSLIIKITIYLSLISIAYLKLYKKVKTELQIIENHA